ncbi:MAG: hypothetical protein H6966_10220 [Chromatiaceae bacterium]|nr:hypothetical protein [Chromatiaceae bacterium]
MAKTASKDNSSGEKQGRCEVAETAVDLAGSQLEGNAAVTGAVTAGDPADRSGARDDTDQAEGAAPPESLEYLEDTESNQVHAVTECELGGIVAPQQTGGGLDLASLALPQNFAELLAVNTEVTSVPVRKPGKQMWFAPHLDKKTWMNMAILKDETDGENYILAPNVRSSVPDDWSAKVLVPCITKQGTLMLWPIRLPGSDGKLDSWNQSALQIAMNYGGRWIRVSSNRESGAYEAVTPITEYEPPVWPDDMPGLFQKALNGVVIDSIDHPILKRLRGES